MEKLLKKETNKRERERRSLKTTIETETDKQWHQKTKSRVQTVP